jgi:transcriptional regulator with XRE-family HTH domain
LENGHYQPSYDLLKKLIEIFEVSGDYLLNNDTDDFEVKIKDKNLTDRIRLIDTLDEKDREALIQVIDSMLTKQKMKQLLNHNPVAINQ